MNGSVRNFFFFFQRASHNNVLFPSGYHMARGIICTVVRRKSRGQDSQLVASGWALRFAARRALPSGARLGAVFISRRPSSCFSSPLSLLMTIFAIIVQLMHGKKRLWLHPTGGCLSLFSRKHCLVFESRKKEEDRNKPIFSVSHFHHR